MNPDPNLEPSPTPYPPTTPEDRRPRDLPPWNGPDMPELDDPPDANGTFILQPSFDPFPTPPDPAIKKTP